MSDMMTVGIVMYKKQVMNEHFFLYRRLRRIEVGAASALT